MSSIIGIGTDIVEVKRFRNILSDTPSFIEKYYTDNERINISSGGAKTAAGIFCAKEAVSKALGTGFSGFTLTDIEILKDSKGKPFATLNNRAKEIVNSLVSTEKSYLIHVSISHSDEYATAVAILEQINNGRV